MQLLGTEKVKGRRRKGTQRIQSKDRDGKPIFSVAVAHLGNVSLIYRGSLLSNTHAPLPCTCFQEILKKKDNGGLKKREKALFF